MGFSFLRVLDTFRDEYEDMIELLAVSVTKKYPHWNDLTGFRIKYWARRVRDRLAHSRAYEEEGALILIQTSAASGIDDGQEWCGMYEGTGIGGCTGLVMV